MSEVQPSIHVRIQILLLLSLFVLYVQTFVECNSPSQRPSTFPFSSFQVNDNRCCTHTDGSFVYCDITRICCKKYSSNACSQYNYECCSITSKCGNHGCYDPTLNSESKLNSETVYGLSIGLPFGFVLVILVLSVCAYGSFRKKRLTIQVATHHVTIPENQQTIVPPQCPLPTMALSTVEMMDLPPSTVTSENLPQPLPSDQTAIPYTTSLVLQQQMIDPLSPMDSSHHDIAAHHIYFNNNMNNIV
ncbi:hypothetical protein C9374_006651 [Naegleria lovaniensis]|uniref:Uncharacterized protein n=1 Tax=Naegleria lovaniensis TaxID=51637 RepID=A0AA88GL58_NAELO|nr:uncharacterized protein C9374_006651 [Naegleria lovaniensis]KAG2379534.1 hypothetical protein C9374_006651 [Naegleria lovaniensis]